MSERRLPAQIAGHLSQVLPEGATPRLVRVTQRGEMVQRPEGRRLDFTAIQVLVVGRVEFEWRGVFGPNPLGKQQARPRSATSRLRATTAYDQTSDIELIPVMGSPPPSMHVKRVA